MAAGKAERDGSRALYSSVFVHELAENYFTRAEAIDLLNIPASTFFDWTKSEGIDFIKIGQVSLFRKDLIMEKRRAA
jgi:hypothetical protein